MAIHPSTADHAGIVESRLNRKSGTVISLYRGEDSGLDDDPTHPWVTVCEAHGNLVAHQTRTLARTAMAFPDWCEDCHPKLFPEDKPARECKGHPAGPNDPMGQTVHCDGSCR